MSNKTIVEINGVKLEVDLTTAKRIDEFRVGDQVKVLVKEYERYTPYFGVIIGFDNFKELPTITVAYLCDSYSPEVKLAYINEKSSGIEICHTSEADKVFSVSDATEELERRIKEKESELFSLKQRRDYFLKQLDNCLEKINSQ